MCRRYIGVISGVQTGALEHPEIFEGVQILSFCPPEFSNDMVHEEIQPENHNNPKQSAVHPDLSSVCTNSQIPLKRKNVLNNTIADLTDIEKQKPKRFDSIKDKTKKSHNYKNDKEFVFLMNLLPHIKNIPKNRRNYLLE